MAGLLEAEGGAEADDAGSVDEIVFVSLWGLEDEGVWRRVYPITMMSDMVL